MIQPELIRLARPRPFAAWSLRTGRMHEALICVAFALLFSTAGAFVLSRNVRVEDLVFGPGRSPAVDALLTAIGVERTAVLVYMLERSFDALLIASAITPIFLWLLGSSAMHAAARLQGLSGHPYIPLLIAFGYATLVYQAPTSLTSIVFTGALSGIATAVSTVMLAWLGVFAHRAIALHYGVGGDRALAIFAIGALAFYLLPLLLIVGALVAIVVAAAILEYF